MLLYNTHGWIHLSIGRPERWFKWGLLEFLCTASMFLLMLHWGPSGIAFAWTASYFLLMFPGLWYAGRPIGLGIGAILGEIWKFFAASTLAAGATVLILRASSLSVDPSSAGGAFLRMILVSLLFFVLYIGFVVALHRGFRPLSETADIIREFLPERRDSHIPPVAVDANIPTEISAWPADSNLKADFAVIPEDTRAK
jgi:polysaccharide transporter, PST family